jgi:hypothetical protein
MAYERDIKNTRIIGYSSKYQDSKQVMNDMVCRGLSSWPGPQREAQPNNQPNTSVRFTNMK